MWVVVWAYKWLFVCVCVLATQESRTDVCWARGVELCTRERQTGDLWRCVVLPCEEREGKAWFRSFKRFPVCMVIVGFVYNFGFLLYKWFLGASQAAQKEELGSSEEHFGQHGQRHIPYHLVWGPAVPVGQPYLCRGWRAAEYERAHIHHLVWNRC